MLEQSAADRASKCIHTRDNNSPLFKTSAPAPKRTSVHQVAYRHSKRIRYSPHNGDGRVPHKSLNA